MEDEARKKLEDKLVQMKRELEERNASIPIHSIRPHQLMAIEELEDKIAEVEKRLEN